ncbi:Glycosyl transferases group 1 [compost metagenome]
MCELVSPLKPFEAMALEKAVVVSSTRALVEIVEDGYNGLVFEKGSEASLQNALEQLIVNTEQRLRLGANARKWIVQERSWDVAGQVCGEAYVL